MTTILLILAVFWLAYSNGANDNFKGVATLYGSRTASFNRALLWSTITTLIGSILSIIIASKLAVAFSGKGLIPPSLVGTPQVLIAIGASSAITIFLATRLGMPTSTTHALTGGLVAIALLATQGTVQWGTLVNSFAAPLILSPIIALTLSAITYKISTYSKFVSTFDQNNCLCIQNPSLELVNLQPNGGAVLNSQASATLPVIYVDQLKNCQAVEPNSTIKLSTTKSINFVHYISAGSVCLSRALNDTPKIAALLIAANEISYWQTGLVALVMAVGGLLNSHKVAETMSKKITDLNPVQGLMANLVTSFLVLFASKFGMPVSTTHVSCGSIFGIGFVNKKWKWKTIAEITTAWVTTLPVSAILCGLIFWIINKAM